MPAKNWRAESDNYHRSIRTLRMHRESYWQGAGMFASLADTLVGELPTNMKGVALADAFVFADGDARGQINDDFN